MKPREGPSPQEAGPPPELGEKLSQFLTAPQFRSAQPRHLPRLTLALARGWSRATRRLGDLMFERDVDTSQRATEVVHFHPDRVWYQASGWSYLRRAIPRSDVSGEDVFLDLGCGKGRVVIQAAEQYPFARVIGVEISEELSRVARENVSRRRRGLDSGRVEIVTADAARYAMPEDVTVVYLYYPFVGATFEKVLTGIVQSLARKPRRFRLVYCLPIMESAILETGLFRAARTVRVIDHGVPHRIVVYESG